MKDTYSANSICYLDAVNRTGYSFGLATQACKLFRKAYLFQNLPKYEELILEMSKMAKQGKSFFESPKHEEIHIFSEWTLHDAIVVVAAFENFFKSVLLEKGFLIHIPKDEKLKKQQCEQPISLEEYKKTDAIIYDEQRKLNRFERLHEKTLAIGILVNKEQYRCLYSLTKDVKAVFDSFIATRNTIHLLMGSATAFSKETLALNRLIVGYFNQTIIPWQNQITDSAQRDTRWKQPTL